jgi:ubiquitin conjugation factor E4 B
MSFLGPFFSQTSFFSDVDQNIGSHFFASPAPLTSDEVERELDGFPIGSRNPGDVKATIQSIQSLSSGIIVTKWTKKLIF